MVKQTFDDGSGWLENHTLMKKEQIIQKEWKQKHLTYEKYFYQSYLLGLWNEDICIPYNVQCDMDDGNFLSFLIIFTHVLS